MEENSKEKSLITTENQETLKKDLEVKDKNKNSPKEIYKRLSSHNKQHFWAVSISIFVIILTIWIGTTFQLVAIGESSLEQKKVEHAEVVNTLIHFKDQFLSSNDSLLLTILSLGNDTIKKVEFCSTNIKTIASWAETCFDISEISKYYLSDEDCKKITDNNFMINIALPAIVEMKDSLISNYFDFDAYIWKYILGNSSRINKDDLVNNKIPKGHLSNVPEFKKEIKSLFMDFANYSDKKNETIRNARNRQVNPDSLLQSSKDLLSLSDTINYKKTNLIYKYIINSLIDNYKIINSNIMPYQDTKIAVLPNSKKDLVKLWKSIREIGVSSDFGSTMFSLIVFLFFGILIWYFILLIVFRNRTPKADIKREWIDINILEEQIKEQRNYIINNWK